LKGERFKRATSRQNKIKSLSQTKWAKFGEGWGLLAHQK
jgi:hypothetical protein